MLTPVWRLIDLQHAHIPKPIIRQRPLLIQINQILLKNRYLQLRMLPRQQQILQHLLVSDWSDSVWLILVLIKLNRLEINVIFCQELILLIFNKFLH